MADRPNSRALRNFAEGLFDGLAAEKPSPPSGEERLRDLDGPATRTFSCDKALAQRRPLVIHSFSLNLPDPALAYVEALDDEAA